MPSQNNRSEQEDVALVLRRLVNDVEGRIQSTTTSAVADVYDSQKREKSSTNRVVIGGGGAILAIVTTLSSWMMDKIDKFEKQQEAQIQALEKISDLEIQLKIVGERQRRLGRRVVSTDIALSNGFQWIAKKIDRTSKRARTEKEPPALRAHRRRAEETAEDRKIDDLFKRDTLEIE